MTAIEFQTRVNLIEDAIATQGFTSLLGARIDAIGPGTCSMSLSRRPELLQQYGTFHGGVLAYLVDNTCAIAAATLGEELPRPLTSEFKICFLAPARGDDVKCRARIIKAGRRLVVVAADIDVEDQGKVTHAATALTTVSIA